MSWGRIVGIALFCVGEPALGAMTGCIEEVPAATGGRTKSQWVAPFVEYIETRGQYWPVHARVLWFSSSGALVAETDSLQFEQREFCFVSKVNESSFVHGMYNDWRIPMSEESLRGVASKNGRTFARYLSESKSVVGVEIYVDGESKTTIRLYPGMSSVAQNVSDHGSVSVIVSQFPQTGPARLFVIDPEGRKRIESEETDVLRVHPSWDGRSALIWLKDGTLRYVDEQGSSILIHLDPALELSDSPVLWVPETSNVLIGSATRKKYILLNCTTGSVLWETEAPKPHGFNSKWVVPFHGHVVTCGLDAVQDSNQQVRQIEALDLATGKPVARWRSTPSPAYTSWDDSSQLMVRDGRLYYLTPDEFCETGPEHLRPIED